MDRGKRLSRSNVIGRQGELNFAKWALDQRLSANKVEVDLGVDFFCQVMVPVEGSLSLEGEGPTLSAQVKTVEENDKPRLKLKRLDAIDLLRQTQATCLFGLLLSDQSVHFQFLTRDFIDELLRFLESSNQEFSISYGSMSSDPNLFQRLLKKYVNPFEQLQLRIHLIQGRIKTAIPGSDISIKSTDEDTVCEIYVPSTSSAFAVDPSAREEVRLKVLREGVIDPRQAGVNLHPAILHALNETQSTRLMLAGVAAEKIKVAIRWRDKTAVERFLRHTYGTEIAYVHPSGLRLTMNTKAEKKPDGHVHAMESEIFHPAHPATLSGNTLLFFRLFQPGAVLSLRSDWDLPLSTCGDGLEHIGEAVDQLPDLCLALSLPRARLLLADLKSEEFARSVWLLQALLLKSIPVGELVPGFIVGPAADLPIREVPTVPISITVPLVLNWKDTGIVIWLDCSGDGFLHEGLLCGVRLRQQLSWRIEKTVRHDKSIYPELWVSKDWPAIHIGSETSGTQDWTFDPAHVLPLEAIVRKRPGNVQG